MILKPLALKDLQERIAGAVECAVIQFDFLTNEIYTDNSMVAILGLIEGENYTLRSFIKKMRNLDRDVLFQHLRAQSEQFTISARLLETQNKTGDLIVNFVAVYLNTKLQKLNLKITFGDSIQQILNELNDKKELLKVLFNEDNVVITISALADGKLLEVNRTFNNYLGLKKEDIINKTSYQLNLFANPEDRNFIRSTVLSQGKLENHKVGFNVGNGKVIVSMFSGYLIYYQEQDCMLSVIKNITDTVNAEEILKSSQNRFKLIWEHSKDGMRITDNDGVILMVNDSFCKIVNMRRKELIGQRYNIIYRTQDKEIQDSDYSSNFKYKNQRFSITGEAVLWNFKKVYFEVSNSFFVEGNGKKLLLSIFRDETERYKNEILKYAIYKIATSVNETSNIVEFYQNLHTIIKDLIPADNFYIAMLSDDGKEIHFPYSVDEFDVAEPQRPLRRGLTEYVLRSNKAQLIDRERDLTLQDEGEVEAIGEQQAIWLGVPLRLDGKTIGVMAVQDYYHSTTYTNEDKKLMTLFAEQISPAIKKVRDAEALKAYAEELEKSNADKDKLFSIVAHDLRSPFNSLLAFSEILEDEADTLSREEIKEFSTKLHRSLRNQYNYLENLLDWALLQTGRMAIYPKPVNIQLVAKKVVSVLFDTAAGKSIDVIIDVPPKFIIVCDENMIYVVLHNLVTNAIKFSFPNSEVKLSGYTENGEGIILVSDTGVGMDKAGIEKVFRIDKSHSTLGTQNEKGTGLGLVLCKELTEQQGGTISVESEPGVGTKIKLAFKMN